MGIVQASSTMNDYVVALWVVIVAAETLELMRHPARAEPLVFASLAAGLALATKPTSVPFILPFAAWSAILLLRASRGLADPHMGGHLTVPSDPAIVRSLLEGMFASMAAHSIPRKLRSTEINHVRSRP